jgi:periplasmic divalent cation tolerance protein
MSCTSEYALLYVTVPDDETGRRLGRLLVEQRLAACVNLLPRMTALYRWEGRLCEEAEVVLLAKTRAALVPAATAALRAAHPYTCPCIVALPITAGAPAFLDWIAAETAPPPG